MTPTLPIAVLGAGPAGMALVAELVSLGEDVLWIAPDRAWSNNYGIWVDELTGTGLDASVFEATWSTPMAATDHGVVTLDRAYGRLDNDRVRDAFASATSRAHRIDATVEEVRERDGLIVLETTDGAYEASFVVDATGHKPVATERPGSNPGFQTAYGILAQIDGQPIDGHDMALMDFRTFDGDWDGPPTFLYAMRLPDGRWFLEETVLVARPAVPINALRDRLYLRLADRGVTVLRVDEEERCFIPMGDELPSPRARAVPFGAAASFVHPATGYSVARSLRAAPGVAARLVETRAETSLDAVWPDERIVARQYYRFGMETLLGFDTEQTHTFFDAFFELPEELWQGYLSDTLAPRDVARVMLTLFGRVGLDMKVTLAGSAFGGGQLSRLVRGLLGSV